jgi:hypothetical protein
MNAHQTPIGRIARGVTGVAIAGNSCNGNTADQIVCSAPACALVGIATSLAGPVFERS